MGVPDGEVEDDHVFEDVDDVGRVGADPEADWTSGPTRVCGGCPSGLCRHSAILTHAVFESPAAGSGVRDGRHASRTSTGSGGGEPTSSGGGHPSLMRVRTSVTPNNLREGMVRRGVLATCVAVASLLVGAAPAFAVSKNVDHVKTLPESRWATAINFLDYGRQ